MRVRATGLGRRGHTPTALAGTERHNDGTKVLAATHVHLDHHNCLEVVITKGRSSEVRPSPIRS
ncbi:MAG: hypothetical protein ACLQOO_06545 [Terriglobia bacterium]